MMKELTPDQVMNIYNQGTGKSACLELAYESEGASYELACYDDFLYIVDDLEKKRKYKYIATVSTLENGIIKYHLIKTNSAEIEKIFIEKQKLSEIICNSRNKKSY